MQRTSFKADTRSNRTFNIAANDSDAKKTASYSRVLVVTELVVSGTQRNWTQNNFGNSCVDWRQSSNKATEYLLSFVSSFKVT